jgi:hypothetical protein
MAGTSVKADDIKTMYLYTQDAGLDGDGLYMKKDETPAALVPEDAYTAPDWPLAPLFADIHVSKADRDRYYDMVTGHDIHPVTAYFTKMTNRIPSSLPRALPCKPLQPKRPRARRHLSPNPRKRTMSRRSKKATVSRLPTMTTKTRLLSAPLPKSTPERS